MMKKFGVIVVSGCFLASCSTIDPYSGEQRISNTTSGAAIGAAVGALSGLFVGGSSRAQRNAVLIGAGVGALSGGAIGNYMDRQAALLRQELQGSGVSVTRNGDQIILNMPGNITFNTDEDSVKAQFYPVLNAVSKVLAKFNQSLVDVYGFTDKTGTPQYNLALSQRRAASVAGYLTSQGIDNRRLSVVGYGQAQPIASNETPEGRAQNRRVEIHIAPIKANDY